MLEAEDSKQLPPPKTLYVSRSLFSITKVFVCSEYFDEEAELSGEDVGSDAEDEDENRENVYEVEAGDDDVLPDEEVVLYKRDLIGL